MILSLTASNLDWGTLWAGEWSAAAGLLPAAGNCSAYPAKLIVVERWCLWLTMSLVFLAVPSPGECSRDVCTQLCSCARPRVRGEGWDRDGLDARMGGEGLSPGSRELPRTFMPIFALLLLFHSSLLPLLPHPTLPDC